MAKRSFEDYANGAMFIAGVVITLAEMYQVHKTYVAERQRKAADSYTRQATARLNAMHDYALKNRISKAEYIVTMNAAKNRIQYDVREVLGENPNITGVIETMLKEIDRKIAKVA